MKDFQLIFREDLINKNKNKSKKKINIELNKIKNRVESSKLMKKLSTFNEVDLSKVLNSIIIQTINENANKLYHNAIFFINLNKLINNQLVLTSNQNAYCEYCFLHSDKLNIKNVTIQHGFTTGFSNLGPPSPEYMRRGSDNYNYFVFSKPIAEFQEKQKKIFSSHLNFYSTGSASSLKHLDKKNKKIINRKTINVCYVFGDITSDTKFHRGRYSDILQYKFISNLVDKFSKQKNIHFYIKCGYSVESEIPNLLNKIKNIPNISIISSTKLLSKKIHNMDLFIISNLSTPLREILATNKSLLIYQNNSTRDETSIFNELLDKRATVIENMKDLNRYLDDFIIQGRNSKILSELKSNNNIFFNTYCLEEDSDPVLNIENNIHNLLNKNQ